MSPAAAQVRADALALSREDRETLRDELDASLVESDVAGISAEQLDEINGRLTSSKSPEEIARAWAVEIDRRAAEHDAGRSTSVSLDELRASVTERLKAVRAGRG